MHYLLSMFRLLFAALKCRVAAWSAEMNVTGVSDIDAVIPEFC